jgi:hypothetical protein
MSWHGPPGELGPRGGTHARVEPRRRCHGCRTPTSSCPCPGCGACPTNGGSGPGCACNGPPADPQGPPGAVGATGPAFVVLGELGALADLPPPELDALESINAAAIALAGAPAVCDHDCESPRCPARVWRPPHEGIDLVGAFDAGERGVP